jgi:hypothetical protein
VKTAQAVAEETNGRGRTRGQLLEDITEQWAQGKQEREELQRVLAEGALKHETTNWLKRTQWLTHFRGKDLVKIHKCSRMPGREDDADLKRMVDAIDRLFFDRCISGLQSMPLMTRLLLASPHHKDAYSRLFGPLQDKASMDQYLIYWRRFLCYSFRVMGLDEAELLEQHGFRFALGQLSVWLICRSCSRTRIQPRQS